MRKSYEIDMCSGPLLIGGISRSRQVLCFCGIPELDVQNSDTGNKQAYRNEDGYECIAHLLVPAKGFNT